MDQQPWVPIWCSIGAKIATATAGLPGATTKPCTTTPQDAELPCYASSIFGSLRLSQKSNKEEGPSTFSNNRFLVFFDGRDWHLGAYVN